MFKVKSFIETSFLDWDGKVSSVIFFGGCNLRCVYCHNHRLIISQDELPDLSWNNIKKYLILHKNWIDGICITGGEPCLSNDLEELIKELKKENFLIKLDTNGFFPEILKNLINQKLIDYIALDIKAPLVQKKYAQITGQNKIDLEKIKKSIKLLQSSSIKFEFRTTVVPGYINLDEIKSIIQNLNKNDKYVIQNFKPENALDDKLRTIKPYTEEEILNFKKIIRN